VEIFVRIKLLKLFVQ